MDTKIREKTTLPPGGATGHFISTSFYERDTMMFVKNLFEFFEVLLAVLFGSIFSAGKKYVKIGRGGGIGCQMPLHLSNFLW
jgi:hypothetical protein